MWFVLESCFNCVVGEDVVVKLTSDDEAKGSSKSVGVLQVWSAKWSCYVDVSDLTEIGEGDRITILVKDSVKKKRYTVMQLGFKFNASLNSPRLYLCAPVLRNRHLHKQRHYASFFHPHQHHL